MAFRFSELQNNGTSVQVSPAGEKPVDSTDGVNLGVNLKYIGDTGSTT
jgi:hypothetical protein